MKTLKEIKQNIKQFNCYWDADDTETTNKFNQLSLEERIYWFINSKEHISFAEFHRFFGEEMEGDIFLELGGDNGKKMNCYAWMGMNKTFVDTIKAMIDKEYIFLNPSVFLVYLFDGKLLPLPLAKRVPKNGYKEPHWVPVVFTTFRQSTSFTLKEVKTC